MPRYARIPPRDHDLTSGHSREGGYRVRFAWSIVARRDAGWCSISWDAEASGVTSKYSNEVLLSSGQILDSVRAVLTRVSIDEPLVGRRHKTVEAVYSVPFDSVGCYRVASVIEWRAE